MKDFVSSHERMVKFNPMPVGWLKEATWAGVLVALAYILAIGIMAL